MIINFGSGANPIPGFYNIDAVRNPRAPGAPELLYAAEFDENGDLLAPVPLPAGQAAELHAYHVIEHVYRWEAPALVREWKRLLQPGGKLVLELPNLLSACKNVLAGTSDQMGMWPIYGDWNHRDPYMMHKHGYTPDSITKLLIGCGYHSVVHLPPQTHGQRTNRDMRIEALC